MNVPTPMNDNARDDRFNRGLERLLKGDPTGIDEIDPELRDTAIEMVKLANDAGWIGADPGEGLGLARPWWRHGRTLVNVAAAFLLVGVISVLMMLGVRVWDSGESQFGSDSNGVLLTDLGPGVCSRAPRTDAEIAAIVRKSESEVEPFQSDGVTAELTGAAIQLTRDWNACLQSGMWDRAMAYESEHFIWWLGQEEFPGGTEGMADTEFSQKLAQRHAHIDPINTRDGMNLTVYSAENFRYVPSNGPPVLLGADFWIVPVTVEGHWVEWPTVVTIEWDGEQFVIVSATREGVPDSPYFRDDALPEPGEATPTTNTSPQN